ncbi:MAG TPA: HNH endonuclease [Archangium sp.]|uniref:HNH endonuclease n=1 Tax=Archangium sp. TaxID=1872627 RepID=UPI002E2EA404|nr:HNH endonuclease [Archangium sp.]HEX5748538.1 HNH endonuclease [Archangium sp.]
MGAELESLNANSLELRRAEGLLEKLTKNLDWEMAQAALDAVGTIDPTPISDLTSAGISLYRGQFLDAGLSVVSAFPYLGDVLGKAAKAARITQRMVDLKRRIDVTVTSINKLRRNNRTLAAAAERARIKKEAAERAAKKKKCKNCPDDEEVSPTYGTTLPKTGGRWSDPNNPGNSDWIPDPNTEKGKKILEVTGGKPITFKDGYPDFSPYAKKSVEIDMIGDHSQDFKNANKAAGIEGSNPPKGFTWHHKEDGVTMELVPQDLHNKVPHTGGAAIVDGSRYGPSQF